MISLNVKGTLGKFGYSNVAEDIVDSVLLIATKQAYKVAVDKAPVDPNDPPVHIKEELKWYFTKMGHEGSVWVKLPYANIAEYGSKHRFPHPFMRPASKAAKTKMRSVIKKSTKESIAKEKKKAG